MTISNSNHLICGDKMEVYKFKPYILEIKNLSSLLYCSNCKNSINTVAKIGDVIKIIIDNDYTKEVFLKILLETSSNSNCICSLLDENGNELQKTDISHYMNYVTNKILIDSSSIQDNHIVILDEPDLFLSDKIEPDLSSIIKCLIKNHIVLILTKLNKKLNLDEKTIELHSYDKIKINEDIIYNLQ